MNTDRVVEASMQVRQAMPDVWQNMVMALRETAALAAADMVKCPPDSLARAQGMAIAAQEISTAFMQAPQLYERLRQVKRNG